MTSKLVGYMIGRLALRGFSGSVLLGILLFHQAFLQAQSLRTSVQSGNWTNRNTWDCSCVPAATDDVIINSGHTVTFVATNQVRHLTINMGGVLSDNGLANTITGNLIVNGTYSGSGVINLNGAGTLLGGVGTITNTATINVTNSKTIPASADLSKTSGDIVIQGAFTITNNGTFTTGGNIIGTVAGSTWNNNSGATLNIGGTNLVNVGTLQASAADNTINYFSSFSHTIKLPELVSGFNTYYNLIISGSGTKTIPNGNVAVNGDLTIYSTLNGNGSTKIFHIRKNWYNFGNFIPGAGTVVFDGIGDQVIENSATEDFHNLTINKSSGNVLLNTNLVVASNAATQANRSTLTMLSGDILAGNNLVTIGRISVDTLTIHTGVVSHSAGKVVGIMRRFMNHHWDSTRRYFPPEIVFYNGDWYRRISSANNMSLPTTSDWVPDVDAIVFPIGTKDHPRLVKTYFKNLTTGLMEVSFVEEFPGNNGLPLTDGTVTIYNTFRDGYWQFNTQFGFTSTDYNLSLTGEGMESVFTIDSDTRILERNAETNNWEFRGTHGTNAGKVVKRNAVDQLAAQYALGDKNNCPVPGALAISGSTDVCKGQSGEVYAVAGSASNQYSWSVIGGTIQGGTGAGTNSDPSIRSGIGLQSITVDWGVIGRVGSVSVLEGIDCVTPPIIITGPLNTLNVSVHALPPASISGKVNVPQNSTNNEQYSVTNQLGYSFQWVVNGGMIVGGNSGPSVNVLWGTANNNASVCVTASYSGCLSSSSTACLDVRIYYVIASVKSGNWATADNAQNRSLWDCSCIPATTDNVTIKNTHNVTVAQNGGVTINHLTIEAGGQLITGTGGTRSINVTGDLNIYGSLAGGVSPINLNAGITANPVIDGNGLITNTVDLNVNSSRSILASSALSKSTGNVNLASGVRVRNFGSVSFPGNIVGIDGSSEWVNEVNSTLEIGGSLLSNGSLVASALGNLIRYNGSVGQSIKVPAAGQYSNLSLSGAGDKSLPNTTILMEGDFANEAVMIPGAGTVEFNGISSILGSVAPNFNHVIVTGTLTSSSGTINISGNFIDNGVFNHNQGTVRFSGTGLSINGNSTKTTFNKIVLGDNASVINEKRVDLLSTLTIGSNATFDADGATGDRIFSLRSLSDNNAQDASIGPLLNGAQVTGKVRVERFMSPQGRLYRYLSSPVVANVSDWKDNFPITGRFPDKSMPAEWPLAELCNNTPLQINNASLFYYNEAAFGNQDLGYVAYPITNGGVPSTNSPLVRGRGYAAFIRLCTTPTIIDVRGDIHSGTFDLPVSYTPTLPIPIPAADGWNLVGNPYPSAISWDASGPDAWTKGATISSAIAITDNVLGDFRYWDGSTSFPNEITNGVIAIGQAFWVKATGPLPQLTIREGVKVSGITHSFYRERPVEEVPALRINLSDGTITDRAYVKIREATRVEEDNWDATKLQNANFNLATVTPGGLQMAINALPSVSVGMVIPLHISNTNPGHYTMRIDRTLDFLNYDVELSDNFAKIKQILRQDEVYVFTITESNAASSAVARFTIRLVKASAPEEKKTVQLLVYPNPVTDKLIVNLGPDKGPKAVAVYTNVGIKMDEFQYPEGTQIAEIDFSSWSSGVYLVRMIGTGYTGWAKVIKY